MRPASNTTAAAVCIELVETAARPDVENWCWSGHVCRWLRSISIILFLNKQDLLAEKVKSGKSKI